MSTPPGALSQRQNAASLFPISYQTRAERVKSKCWCFPARALLLLDKTVCLPQLPGGGATREAQGGGETDAGGGGWGETQMREAGGGGRRAPSLMSPGKEQAGLGAQAQEVLGPRAVASGLLPGLGEGWGDSGLEEAVGTRAPNGWFACGRCAPSGPELADPGTVAARSACPQHGHSQHRRVGTPPRSPRRADHSLRVSAHHGLKGRATGGCPELRACHWLTSDLGGHFSFPRSPRPEREAHELCDF